MAHATHHHGQIQITCNRSAMHRFIRPRFVFLFIFNSQSMHIPFSTPGGESQKVQRESENLYFHTSKLYSML